MDREYCAWTGRSSSLIKEIDSKTPRKEIKNPREYLERKDGDNVTGSRMTEEDEEIRLMLDSTGSLG